MNFSENNVKKLRAYVEARSIPEPNSGCWLWLLSDGSHKYPQGAVSWFNGKQVDLAHRISFTAYKGEIPDGYDIDHLCRVRCCVNPDHLEAVLPAVNRRRQFGYASEDFSKCPHGHTRIYTDSNGKRCCTDCKYKYVAKYRKQKKREPNK